MTLKSIPGYEGLYSASDAGRIFSHVSNEYLSPTPRPDGYCQVGLVANGHRKFYYVHRLVLAAFDNFDLCSELQVDHIDTIKSNNCRTNLRPVSQTENELYKHGRLGTEPANQKICTKCKGSKLFSEFYTTNYGFSSWCKMCVSATAKEKRSA